MEKLNDGSKLNIYQKLLEVQTELKVKKERENKFADFNFRSAEDILREVKPVLKKYNLLLLLQDELVQMDNAMYIKATAQIIECDSPNAKLETHAYAKECAEPKPKMDSSQTTGCCSSYARKYALNALFCLDDASQDPDSMDNAKTTKKAEVKKPKQEIGLFVEFATYKQKEEYRTLVTPAEYASVMNANGGRLPLAEYERVKNA